MGARVRDILDWLDAYAPFDYAAAWDHCGLQVGDPEAEISVILVALDPGSQTLTEAEARGCHCLVTHHPLIFRPLQAVRRDEFPGQLVMRCIRAGMHLIAVHTNLDAALEGTNDCLARLFSIRNGRPLTVERALTGGVNYGGIGRVGDLATEMSLLELTVQAGRLLGSETVRAAGDPQRLVRSAAVCSGSGGSLVEEAIGAGVDVYITGDIKYHEAQRAIEGGLSIIDIGHFASERLIVGPLAAYLRRQAAQHSKVVTVWEAVSEKDPFWLPKDGYNPRFSL